MSGFLQRLVAHSQSTEHAYSVRPRLGARFEPAFGVQAQTPTFDAPLHGEDTISPESLPAEPNMPDERPLREQPARTIAPPVATSSPEPATPAMAKSVQPAPKAGERDSATGDTPASPDVEKPRPQPDQPDATSDDDKEDVSRTERRHRPIRDVEPAAPVQPRAPMPSLEGDEPGDRSMSGDEEIIRTVRVVRETPIPVPIENTPVESPRVRPAPDEQQQSVSHPVTPEPQVPQPVENPQEPARVRAEPPAEPIRPKVIAAPVPMGAEQQPPYSRRRPADPPTIRVTIGRIEVRAVQAQQPASTQTRRQPVRRTPALSLDDYLAKRNEGGR